MPCRINAGRLWSGRLLLEQAFTPARSWFLTFTIADPNMVYTTGGHQTVVKDFYREWIRYTQRQVGHFRHVSIGEYGDETGRAHYHMALFPENDFQVTPILKHWELGNTSAGELNPKRCRYVVRYTAKKLTKKNDHRLFPDQEPEFKVASPGIGKKAIPYLVKRYQELSGKKILEERGDIERTLRFGGKIYPIDRYILNKVRAELGIPLKHSERLQHEGYFEWHQTENAEWEPIEATQLETFHKEKQRRRGIGQTKKI